MRDFLSVKRGIWAGINWLLGNSKQSFTFKISLFKGDCKNEGKYINVEENFQNQSQMGTVTPNMHWRADSPPTKDFQL